MYLLFDIGATKMRFAVTHDGKRFGNPKITATPKDFENGISVFKNAVRVLSQGKKFRSAVGGIAGPFNKSKTALFHPNNLPQWHGKPLKRVLERTVGAPVFLKNDTALAGLGEAVFGAGKGKSIVAYVTVSTGVNGARIVDGKIDRNAFGFEIGEQIVKGKTLEDTVSGTAVERQTHKKPYEILDKKFWDKLALELAYGLNNTIVHWSPEVVVLGGSMMKKIGIPVPRVIFHLQKILKVFPQLPILKKAQLGDLGGLYGARAYLNQQLKNSA